MSKTVIFAPNIHVGGGLVLLKGLIESWPSSMQFNAYLDVRVKGILDLPELSNVVWVRNTIFDRLRCDYMLSKAVSENDTVTTFNGVPPVFKVQAKLIVFLQNRILIDDISHLKFNSRTKLRLTYERFLFRLLRKRVDEFIVQTDTFKSLLSIWFGSKAVFRSTVPSIKVMPFMQPIDLNTISVSTLSARESLAWDFIYVADGLPHKSHLMLFDAWEELARQDLFPSLALTLGPLETELLSKIRELQEMGLKITNLGYLSHESLLQQYRQSRVLIYPSLQESFGLPLVEAFHLGLPILASELDYVYDVCKPNITFDPTSYRSIARAVSRFLGVNKPVLEVSPPSKFLEYIISGKNKSVSNVK